jgi:hypothetical protein
VVHFEFREWPFFRNWARVSNIIQTRPHRLRLRNTERFQSSALDSRAPEDSRRCYRLVSISSVMLCVSVQSPAFTGLFIFQLARTLRLTSKNLKKPNEIGRPRPRHYRPWRTNVSLAFSIRRMLLESSAAAPSNETRIPQAPVAERPVALPPARRWSCKCGSRYSP